MKIDRWYQDGLRFRCRSCGDCCTGAPGYVWVNQREIQEMAALMEMDCDTFEAWYVRPIGIRKSLVELPNDDCVFFDPGTRRCAVYSARPRQCRTWPFWRSNLRTPETWAATCQNCPGSGQGRLFSLEEIEQRANVMLL
ncbi:MAG: YkgJ family cysteine cluster protein [Pirellulales bacterium]|nr:YkgJ family cysteine cluster protein [Pirellulales bacterium]